MLRNFLLPDGSFKSIPAQRKKREAVLCHILKSIEPGQRFPEKQVNEMLRRYHGDPAALQHYMVDSRLLARERGE